MRAGDPGGQSVAVSRCAMCSSSFDERAWKSLAFSHRIEASEVARLVASWPPRRYVEVRICSTCGRALAARRDAG